MAKGQELEVAFEAALTHVERPLAGGMKTMNGDSARPQLEKLERDTEITLIAALGRIIRSEPPALS